MIDLEAPPWLFSKKTLRNWSRFASDLRRRHPGDFSYNNLGWLLRLEPCFEGGWGSKPPCATSRGVKGLSFFVVVSLVFPLKIETEQVENLRHMLEEIEKCDKLPSLKVTAKAPENGWKRLVSFWDGIFSGAMLVLGSVWFVAEDLTRVDAEQGNWSRAGGIPMSSTKKTSFVSSFELLYLWSRFFRTTSLFWWDYINFPRCSGNAFGNLWHVTSETKRGEWLWP